MQAVPGTPPRELGCECGVYSNTLYSKGSRERHYELVRLRAGKSRRALSPWYHVALNGRLSGVLSASSVDKCVNVVASRWAS
jgi:hypothetical protein